jgi:hypothetical protein
MSILASPEQQHSNDRSSFVWVAVSTKVMQLQYMRGRSTIRHRRDAGSIDAHHRRALPPR